METKIKPVAKAIQQLIRRDLGKYGGYSGTNKLFHLVCVIDQLRFHLGEDFVIEEVNKELERLKKYQEQSKQPTIYSKIKNWDNIKKTLDYLRPKLADIQMEYDHIRDKEFRSKREIGKRLKYRKLIKKVSPYQPEIYFMFNLLMKISGMQTSTIPPQAFITPELSKYGKFPEKKRTQPIADVIVEKDG